MVHDNRFLDKYIKLCGSVYSATIFLGLKARELAEKYDNVITHAEALSWLLSGHVPQGVYRYKELVTRRSEQYLDHAQDYLKGVSDSEVRDSVLKSLKKSRSVGHLVYVYEGVYSKCRQSRVRVITNKLWNEIHELEY